MTAILADLRAAVGEANVISEAAELARGETATFATTARVLAMVRPASTREVCRVVALANTHRVAVYPTSRGRSWGFGSRAPTADAVLIDLGRMNEVLAIDEELAFATVGPGVSFGDLRAELDARGSRLTLSTVGAGPTASVLANALERGDGSGPTGDRYLHLAALEVVLPTGEVVHTGSDRFAVDRAAPMSRWPAGPAIDGLFSQSNLGIVTRGTVWLTPRPRSTTLVRFAVEDHAAMARVVDACRELKLEGTLANPVGFWNDYRVLSTQRRFPFDQEGASPPLRRSAIHRLLGSSSVLFGSTSITAPTTAQADAGVARVRAVLGRLSAHFSIEARAGDPALAFAEGRPHEESLASLYWRKRGALPATLDPDRDGCGAMWIAAALPFRGREVVELATLVEETMLAHGFEPLLAFTAQAPRAMQVFPLIVFDRTEPDEDARALACHDAVTDALVSRGYPLTRLGVHSMGSPPPAADATGELLEKLRDALDPRGVLAPGRYVFPRR